MEHEIAPVGFDALIPYVMSITKNGFDGYWTVRLVIPPNIEVDFMTVRKYFREAELRMQEPVRYGNIIMGVYGSQEFEGTFIDDRLGEYVYAMVCQQNNIKVNLRSPEELEKMQDKEIKRICESYNYPTDESCG